MILADTSIWIEHFRHSVPRFQLLLTRREVLAHPFVLGELSLGGLPNREDVLARMHKLPQATTAADSEVLQLIREHRLHGRGIGYLDAHLLAATLLTDDARLWTLDRRLQETARHLGVAAALMH